MIQDKDSPEGEYNKFLLPDGTGHRGVLISRTADGKEAVLRAVTEGEGIIAGRSYLVREKDPAEYPWMVKEV